MDSIQETCRQQATLHALTDKRLLSLGPSADGLGVSFQQFDGAVVKDAADSAGYRGYSGPVLPLWRIVAPACPSRSNSSRFHWRTHRQPGKYGIPSADPDHNQRRPGGIRTGFFPYGTIRRVLHKSSGQTMNPAARYAQKRGKHAEYESESLCHGNRLRRQGEENPCKNTHAQPEKGKERQKKTGKRVPVGNRNHIWRNIPEAFPPVNRSSSRIDFLEGNAIMLLFP